VQVSVYSYCLNETNEVKFTHIDWVKPRAGTATSATNPPIHIPGATARVLTPATESGYASMQAQPRPSEAAAHALPGLEASLAAASGLGVSAASPRHPEPSGDAPDSSGLEDSREMDPGEVGREDEHLSGLGGGEASIGLPIDSRDEDAPELLQSVDLEDERPMAGRQEGVARNVAELGKVPEQVEQPVQMESPKA
jgi:hypothetical protein